MHESNEETADASPLTRRHFLLGAIALAGAGLTDERVSLAAPETKPTLYLVATAHNDTQWNWTCQSTIDSYIPRTVRLNDALFARYPNYNFNYEGVIHYRFCKEYHPDLYATIKKRVAEGRWKLSGGWINAVDTHLPSAESLFRQALYGQQFFRAEFGHIPRDIFLPDCFGFPFSLPTIGRHSGFVAFSTQKFSNSWGCFIPPPFAVGNWEGVDGSTLVTALRPGAYVTKVRADPSVDPKWQDDFVNAAGAMVDLRYFGTGDTGGAPDDESVRWVNGAVSNKAGAVVVRNTAADQMAKDLTPAQIAALPHYRGELLLKLHAVGCYTSQAAMKRWNRQNEQLGDAAERASLIAAHLGGPAYPQAALTECYLRFLWHQFHDDVTGTCIPQAYTFSWNDEILSLSRFADMVETGAAVAALALNTAAAGVPLVVYNPLALDRRDIVEATVTFPTGSAPRFARVFDTETHQEVPSQVTATEGDRLSILFLADAPSVGYRVFDVRQASQASPLQTGMKVSESGLENSRYRVTIDGNGDISSLFDKTANAELLASPARIELLEDVSRNSPAWEITHRAVVAPPRGYAANPTVKVVESGPARVSLEITRKIEGASTLVQYLRLTPDAASLEIENHLDWKDQNTLIKAAFHTTASNPKAVFDLDLGVIERGNAADNLWEVPAHAWAGITDAGGKFGLAVLNDCKYGWDKPADDILRHTLLHSPLAGEGRRYQGMQDVGRHRFTYALAGHKGDWRDGQIPQQSARLNQPLRAFQTSVRPTAGPRSLSFAGVSTEQVQIRALKKAEASDEVIVRVQELFGRPAKGLRIRFSGPVTAAREVNAIEEPIGPFPVSNGCLTFDLQPFQPRSFAVKVSAAAEAGRTPLATALELPFNLSAVTFDGATAAADFDGQGRTIPGELFPTGVIHNGLGFPLGDPHGKNALSCTGQRLSLPTNVKGYVYLLAAAVGGDTPATFIVEGAGGAKTETTSPIAEWTGHIAQWYSTLDYSKPDGGTQVVQQTEQGTIENLEQLKPAFVKRDRIAWVGTHRHTPTGNEAQIPCYLFAYRIDLPKGATTLVLPSQPNIRIFSAIVAHNPLADTVAAHPLFAAEFV